MQRIGLLGPEEKYEMEKYVMLKLEDMKTWVLAWEPDEYSTDIAMRLVNKPIDGDKNDHQVEVVEQLGDGLSNSFDKMSVWLYTCLDTCYAGVQMANLNADNLGLPSSLCP